MVNKSVSTSKYMKKGWFAQLSTISIVITEVAMIKKTYVVDSIAPVTVEISLLWFITIMIFMEYDMYCGLWVMFVLPSWSLLWDCVC